MVASENYRRPNAIEKLFNRCYGVLVRYGLTTPQSAVLSSRGRHTGQTCMTPVYILAIENSRYIVAPRGVTQWVLNVRAHGAVELTHGKQTESYVLTEVVENKSTILKAYLARFCSTVQRFFSLKPDAPDKDFERVCDRYPIFQIEDR